MIPIMMITSLKEKESILNFSVLLVLLKDLTKLYNLNWHRLLPV